MINNQELYVNVYLILFKTYLNINIIHTLNYKFFFPLKNHLMKKIEIQNLIKKNLKIKFDK
jgi:hypothetical protein